MNKDALNAIIDRVNDKLMNLGLPEIEEGLDLETILAKGLNIRDFGIEEWDWPQGVGLYGLTQLQAARGNTQYDEFLKGWIENNLKIGLPSRNINTTAPYLAVLDYVSRHDVPEWEVLCKEHADWLVNDLPKTIDGGFQHVTSAIGDRNGVMLNDGQIWADTLFMAVLFLGRMGVRYNNPVWTEESIHQFLVHIEYLYEREKGLFYHGWTFHGCNNFGRIFWCRGNSWFTYGAIAWLASLGDAVPSFARRFVLDAWRHQVDALAALQDESGLWHTVLDDPTSYVETSGTAAIAAGILLGIRSGILPKEYEAMGRKAIDGILANIAEDGTVLQVSAGTAMGMNADHYKHISIMPMAYGQSLTSLALTEALYLED